MNEKEFHGDKKLPLKSLLAKYERRFIDKNVTRFPRWLQGYHLTLTTIAWSVGLIVFGYQAQHNRSWLWLSSLMFFLQWFTDCFDGALGRHRDTGIPKWGFFMDHLLDFVFMGSALVGYSFLFTGLTEHLIHFLIPVFGCFMVSSYLAFGASNEFKITYLWIGPTEVRVFFIMLNCFIIIFGTDPVESVVPYVFVFSIIALCVVVYRTQKYLWRIDMTEKEMKRG